MAEKDLTRYFQNASNQILDILSKSPEKRGATPLTDQILAEKINVSLNLIQRVLIYLRGKGLLTKTDVGWKLTRALRKDDYFDLVGHELSQRDSVDNYCIKQLSSGRFRPGDRISELKLAREASVSTGSVRESLLRISKFGVIAKDARRQWHVVEWTAVRIDQLMEWRLLVERHCVEKLLSARPKDLLETLANLVQEHKRLLKNKKLNAEEFAGLDERLHATILAASGNAFIEDAFRTIWFIIRFQFLHQDLDSKFVELGGAQHIRLLDAILEGNGAEARKQLTQHLNTAADTLKRLNAVK